ncbi:25155_t:CDS:1, partial [Gigaspora rosea]
AKHGDAYRKTINQNKSGPDNQRRYEVSLFLQILLYNIFCLRVSFVPS